MLVWVMVAIIVHAARTVLRRTPVNPMCDMGFSLFVVGANGTTGVAKFGVSTVVKPSLRSGLRGVVFQLCKIVAGRRSLWGFGVLRCCLLLWWATHQNFLTETLL